jgi:hypothetical protein
MSKNDWDSVVITKKGAATPAATTQLVHEPRKQEAKEPRKEEPALRRKRVWEGQDEWIKVNYEVQKRVHSKIKTLKTWERIDSIRDFVSHALEAAVDREIAKAEREGF